MRAAALVVAVLALAATATAASPGTLRLAERTPPTLDPALAESPDAVMLQNAICDRLYTVAPAGAVVPQIAIALPKPGRNAQRPKQWTTYTIKLNQRYRFQDGSRVTAFSFVEAFARDADPDMGSPALRQLRNVVGVAAVAASEASAVSGVRAVNDTTLELGTMRPIPNLAALLAEPYFCPVEEGTPDAPDGVQLPPSAGPYEVAANTPGEIVLKRNPHYGGTRKPRLAEIDLRSGVGFDPCRAAVVQGKEDICLDALPQHARTADLAALTAQGWLSKRIGCLAWLPVVRLDLTKLC
jgi:ABC-type transport system substrate-binding protein